jgi:hydroxypyruvate reductase
VPDAAIIRATIESALRALPAALDPYTRTRRILSHLDLPDEIAVVAIGKAARAMATAAVDVFDHHLTGGVLVALDASPLDPLEVHVGSHPIPDAASERAGRAVLAVAGRADHDHLLVLVSGGGSAMAEVPRHPLDIDAIGSIVARLLRAGTPIDELNVVRRHLSELKNGGLSGRSQVPVTTLVISDVVDGPASTVASGPTLSDDSTAQQALAVLERRLGQRVSPAVHTALATPVPRRRNEAVHVVADRHTAHSETSDRLAQAGLDPSHAVRLEGDAAVMAHRMIGIPGLAIGTGETTVTVTGGGSGGRNQHGALAAAIEIDGRSVVFGTLGTDGVDGPTDAAGAVVDGATCQRIRSAGIDPADALKQCDSHRALDAAGDLIRTGPTGTNVADVWISYVPPTT